MPGELPYYRERYKNRVPILMAFIDKMYTDNSILKFLKYNYCTLLLIGVTQEDNNVYDYRKFHKYNYCTLLLIGVTQEDNNVYDSRKFLEYNHSTLLIGVTLEDNHLYDSRKVFLIQSLYTTINRNNIGEHNISNNTGCHDGWNKKITKIGHKCR